VLHAGNPSQRRVLVRAHRKRLLSIIGFVVLTALTLAAASPAAGAALATTKFVSKRYGYSIVFPGGSDRWYASFASVNWSSRSLAGRGSPDLDTIYDLRTGRVYLLAARPSGSSLQQWTEFVISARPPDCGAPPQWLPNARLAGARARVLTWSCTGGSTEEVFAITALHAHRGYFMFLASPATLSRTSDLHAFDAARRSFRFLHK
jgi:hypothetical protein